MGNRGENEVGWGQRLERTAQIVLSGAAGASVAAWAMVVDHLAAADRASDALEINNPLTRAVVIGGTAVIGAVAGSQLVKKRENTVQ